MIKYKKVIVSCSDTLDANNHQLRQTRVVVLSSLSLYLSWEIIAWEI